MDLLMMTKDEICDRLSEMNTAELRDAHDMFVTRSDLRMSYDEADEIIYEATRLSAYQPSFEFLERRRREEKEKREAPRRAERAKTDNYRAYSGEPLSPPPSAPSSWSTGPVVPPKSRTVIVVETVLMLLMLRAKEHFFGS